VLEAAEINPILSVLGNLIDGLEELEEIVMLILLLLLLLLLLFKLLFMVFSNPAIILCIELFPLAARGELEKPESANALTG